MARIISIFALLSVLFVVAPAEGGKSNPSACGAKEFSYAGLQSQNTAHGVSATITPLAFPTVSDGHVGGWIGVGGTEEGPNGTAEWLQVGFASFAPENSIRLYYEVTVTGKDRPLPRARSRRPAGREAQGRRCSRCRSATPGGASGSTTSRSARPIHLPGSHGKWYPQALAENWNGGTGTCNTLRLPLRQRERSRRRTAASGSSLEDRYLFEDAGYQVMQTSRVPSNFVTSSL